MNNYNSPQMPPITSSGGPAAQTGVASGSIAPGNTFVPPSPTAVRVKSGDTSLLKTVIIVLLSLLLVGALLLSYYFFSEYRALNSSVNEKIESGVLEASKEIEDELRAEYDELEKSPYNTFTGPADYGSLSFKYPRTWSVYIETDESAEGGDYFAYFHPKEIPPLNNDARIALTIDISPTTFEKATSDYSKRVEKGELTTSAIEINGQEATRFDGQITKDITGSVVIMKYRDKVITFQTDAEIYRDDFQKILDTVTFNK